MLNKIIFQSKSFWIASTVPKDYNFTVAYDEGWILTEKIDRARGSFNILDLLDTIRIHTQHWQGGKRTHATFEIGYCILTDLFYVIYYSN